jgi:cell division protein FtsB
MSVVLKLPTGKNRSLSTTAISVVLGLFALLFLVRFGQELLLEHDLNARSAAQRRANAALRDDNTRLRASLQYYQSTKYIEQRAREEEVLIPVGLDATLAGGLAGTTAQGAEENATLQEPSNWEKWFGLFAPAKSADQFP